MEELKIVATIIAKDKYKKELLREFEKVVAKTRKETGNLYYSLHQDINNPLIFVILEVWESQDAIKEHNKTEHYRDFKKAIEGKIDSINVNILTDIY